VNGVVRRLADTSAARQDLGSKAQVEREEGFREHGSQWERLRDGIAATRKVGAR
jgi:UDP-glucose 4-epimerase